MRRNRRRPLSPSVMAFAVTTFVRHDSLRCRRTLRTASLVKSRSPCSCRKAGRSRVSRIANMDGDTVLALIDTHVFKCGWFISCTSVHDFDWIYSSSLLLLFMCQLIILNGPSLLIDAHSNDECYWLLMCLMIARVSPVVIVLIVWVTGFVWLDIGYAIAYLHWWNCTCVEFYDDCLTVCLFISVRDCALGFYDYCLIFPVTA